MDRPAIRSPMIGACLAAGMYSLLGAPGYAHVQESSRAIQPVADVELIELAERSCFERITRADRVRPQDVSIQTATRRDFRVIVYGVVQQPPPGKPMAFVCAVSGFGGTGGSFGQVFNLQYSRIEEAG